VPGGSGDQLVPVPAPVEQPDQDRSVTHAGQRNGPSWVYPDLEGVPVAPHWQQA